MLIGNVEELSFETVEFVESVDQVEEIKGGNEMEKFAEVLVDIWGFGDEEEDVLVAKKGDIVKVKEVNGSTAWLEVENWEWYVITKSANIKLIENGGNKVENLKNQIEYLEKAVIDWTNEIEEMIEDGCNEELITETIEHKDMLIRSLKKHMEELEMSRPKLKVGMTVKVELNYYEVVGTITETSDSDMFYLVDENDTLFKFYSDINQVTILNDAIFHDMENIEVINPEDHDFYDNAYKVSLHYYDNNWFGVFASCEQDALDIVVDYLEEKGLTGMFYTVEEVEEDERNGNCDNYFVAGNHCHYLDAEYTQIEQVR